MPTQSMHPAFKIIVISPNFAFRGPIAAAFLESFHPGIKVYGLAAETQLPMHPITKQMLWESYLEDSRPGLLTNEEAMAYDWYAGIWVSDEPMKLDWWPTKTQVFWLQAVDLSTHQPEEARRLRDEIKNRVFKLLRDELKLKLGGNDIQLYS